MAQLTTQTATPRPARDHHDAGGGGCVTNNPGLNAALDRLRQAIDEVPPEVYERRRRTYEGMRQSAREKFEAELETVMASQPVEKRFAAAWAKAGAEPRQIAKAVIPFLVPGGDGRSVERLAAMIQRHGAEAVKAEATTLVGEIDRRPSNIGNPLSVLQHRLKRAEVAQGN